MKKWELKIAKGFDPDTQKIVGLITAQLDEQMSQQKRMVKDLTVKQLEWQPNPGMNTIGVLLLHQAIAEVWWILIAAKELPPRPDGERIIKRLCIFDDDGIPLPPDSKHPTHLRGITAAEYLSILDKSRRAVRKELRQWYDKDLNKLYVLRKEQCSYVATLHHVLEHFCGHFGQILLLKHMMRDAGVLKDSKKTGS